MTKKVLFISPTPTHPTNAGNRMHIKSLINFFKEQKWETHFLYLEYENYDKEAMLSFFNNHLTVVPRSKIFNNKKTPSYVLKKLLILLNHYKRKIQLAASLISKEQFLYNGEVDNNFSVFVKQAISQLQKKDKFEIVICEYVSMSKALDQFNDNVLKILDAHDKFTDRFIIYLKNKLEPTWLSLYRSEERKALRRADIIIALQENERSYFEKLSGKKSICFYSFPEVNHVPSKIFEKKLLYFASGNVINVRALEYFVEEIFPIVKQKHPDVLLLVGGSICDAISKKEESFKCLGLIDNPVDFYKQGDIVINPELEGSGLKIKTIEALCYGLPVVTTRAGASGATGSNNDHLMIAETSQDFANALIELIEDETLRNNIKTRAFKWVNVNKEKMKKELQESISAK